MTAGDQDIGGDSYIENIFHYTEDIMLESGVSRKLIDEDEIATIVKKLGEEITTVYQQSGGELIVVGLLRGSFVFMADLVRKIHYPLVVDFMAVSSYGKGARTSSKNVRIDMDLSSGLADKHHSALDV